MNKTAKLVVTTFISRVIVDDNTTEDQIANLAKLKIQKQLDNGEVIDNIETIMLDTECPYDPSDDDPVTDNRETQYGADQQTFLKNGFHHIKDGVFRLYYNANACIELEEIDFDKLKYPQFTRQCEERFDIKRQYCSQFVEELIEHRLHPREQYTSENYLLVLSFDTGEINRREYRHYAVHDYIDCNIQMLEDDEECVACGSGMVTRNHKNPKDHRNCSYCGIEYALSGQVFFDPKNI